MKQFWQRIESKIDALTLRERAIIFTLAVVVLITVMNMLLLDPLWAKQTRLSQQLQQEQQQITALQTEIQRIVAGHAIDPDIANRERLRQLRQQATQMESELHGVQKGLVSPDKMATVLEEILKRNGRLQLASLKTLPVASLNEETQQDNKPSGEKNAAGSTVSQIDKAPPKAGMNAIYKHGVEIVVQGGYLDIMDYLTQLERMPWQVFWAKATLNVDEYPKASLTLTLFTLSLDKKWLNI